MLFPFCKAKLLITVTRTKPRGQKSHRHCHGNSLTVPLTDLWKQSLQQDFTALALRFSKLFMQLMRGMQPTLYTQFKSTCWWYKKECWTTGLLHLLQNYQHKPWGIYSWNVNRTVWGIRSVHELCFDPMSVQRADLTTRCLVTWWFRMQLGFLLSPGFCRLGCCGSRVCSSGGSSVLAVHQEIVQTMLSSFLVLHHQGRMIFWGL